MEQLLEPGWAGVLTLEEAEYIAQHLAYDARLRRLWHIRRRKRYPLQLIAEKAFPQNPTEGRHIIENLLAVRSSHRNRSQRPNPDEIMDFPVSDADVASQQLTLGLSATV